MTVILHVCCKGTLKRAEGHAKFTFLSAFQKTEAEKRNGRPGEPPMFRLRQNPAYCFILSPTYVSNL